MKISKKTIATVITITSACGVFAQDDMLSLLDSAGAKKTHEKVMATFKDAKIINAQTIETVKGKTFVFNISHLFGNIGTANGGAHALYGLDNVSDVRIGFDFGITNDLTVGVGRSKQNELIDAMVKYRILSQTLDNHIPFSLAIYADAGYNPQTPAQFYNGIDPAVDFKQNDVHRFSYLAQVILARKFGSRLSIQLLPTYQHRNYVLGNINMTNGAEETNDLFSIGGGFRLKITKRIAILADYFYTFSKYRTGNTANPFYNPLSIGVEIETGGHVFHINFTNAASIVENNFIPRTTDDWLAGGFKFGFNISRAFNVGRRKG